MRPLVLVGKADCPLCEEAREVVERVAAELGLTVEQVDLASSPELEKYRDQVPVVLWRGRPVAKLRVQEDVLRKRLKEASEG
jgi:glutaredoxin